MLFRSADGKPKTVERRYRDFLELHNFLIDKFIDKFIVCSFPEKSIFKKFEDRSLKLQRYLEHVTENCACEELTKWLSEDNYRLPILKQSKKSTISKLYSGFWSYLRPA